MNACHDEVVTSITRCWYLLQCKPSACERALEHLSRQGYEAFLPRLRREVLRRGRRDVVEEPLFPHYLFVRLSEVTDNWAPIRSTRGVAGLVRFGERPLAVPDAVVNALREPVPATEQAVEPLFKSGDRLRIVAGPLAGLEAVLAARDGTERVILLIHLLNQTQKISLSLTQVRSLSEA